MSECNFWLSWRAVQFYAQSLFVINRLCYFVNILLGAFSFVVFCQLDNKSMEMSVIFGYRGVMFNFIPNLCSSSIACLLRKSALCFVLFLPT